MISDYGLRLLLLSFGCFFLVNLALGLCVRLAAPAVQRWVRLMKPQHEADMLLALRLAPAVTAMMGVVTVCVPSYLRFEPFPAEERIGLFLQIVALLGAVVWVQAFWRAARAMWATSKSANGPVLRLTGILSPVVVASEDVRAVLSEEQWRTVLRHEEAHVVSFDNLKRLLMLLAPALTPFDDAWASLEQAWVDASERAADAAAVDGDSERAVVLAEALVRLARHGLDAGAGQLASSFAQDPEQLRVRVTCLLETPPAVIRRSWILPTSGFALALLLAVAQAYQSRVHELLEMLVD